MQEGNAFADEWVAASSSSAASAGTGYEGSEQVSLPRLSCECDSVVVALQCTSDKKDLLGRCLQLCLQCILVGLSHV